MTKEDEMEKIAKIKATALQLFEPEAYTRFMTVMQYNSEKAVKALELCMQYFYKKQRKINDEELKNILFYLSQNERKEGSIQIKRK
ncbi:MAG: hypothetical protein QXI89_01685 [Candidatus Anstonellales archaeon]